MNVTNLRRLQASVLDESKPFSMGHWSICLLGHAMALEGITINATFDSELGNEWFSRWAGIPRDRTGNLLLGTDWGGGLARITRQKAAREIDRLIGLAKPEPVFELFADDLVQPEAVEEELVGV